MESRYCSTISAKQTFLLFKFAANDFFLCKFQWRNKWKHYERDYTVLQNKQHQVAAMKQNKLVLRISYRKQKWKNCITHYEKPRKHQKLIKI